MIKIDHMTQITDYSIGLGYNLMTYSCNCFVSELNIKLSKQQS